LIFATIFFAIEPLPKAASTRPLYPVREPLKPPMPRRASSARFRENP